MNFVQFSIENSVAKIVLDRPEAFNAITFGLAEEVIECLDECYSNDDVRVVVITGNGKAFCSGQDLKESLGDDPQFITRSLEKKYNPIVKRIFELEKPVVALVNGPAVGAGANLAIVCDIVLATESSYFTQAFTGIGLIPDTAGTYVLPRLVGFQRAIALALLGDKVSAKDAEAMGMIYKHFSDDTFQEESTKIITRLANMPTKALGLTKMAYNQGLSNDFYTQIAVERHLQNEAAKTHDFKEGVAAFIEKRKPKFIGK